MGAMNGMAGQGFRRIQRLYRQNRHPFRDLRILWYRGKRRTAGGTGGDRRLAGGPTVPKQRQGSRCSGLGQPFAVNQYNRSCHDKGAEAGKSSGSFVYAGKL